MIHRGDSRSWAKFSDDLRYRYELGRCWSPNLPTMLVAGLNPSTANETANDPTIRRCLAFAAREHCGTLLMVNAFAWRATEPAELLAAADAVGPENNAAIADARDRALIHVAAWGKPHPRLRWRLGNLTQFPWRAFKLTDDGLYPRHPLYLRADCPLVMYR
jgi:hypothetical protein